MPTYMVLDETGAEGRCCCRDDIHYVDPPCRELYYPKAVYGVPDVLRFLPTPDAPFSVPDYGAGWGTDPVCSPLPPDLEAVTCAVLYPGSALAFEEEFVGGLGALCEWVGGFVWYTFTGYDALGNCVYEGRTFRVWVKRYLGGAVPTFRLYFADNADTNPSGPLGSGTVYECPVDPAEWDGSAPLTFNKVCVASALNPPPVGTPVNCVSWPEQFTVGP